MLIAVEGCLGAGKSTVARGLSALRGSRLLLEDFEANPFLPAFYVDPIGNALETEFTFLMLHFHQLKSIAPIVATEEVIADFHLGKDVLYAELNLSDQRARRVFAELYSLCANKVPSPDLLVFLSASTELIIDRIRTRSREFEQVIDAQYYRCVNEAYEALFAGYAGRKLRVDMNEWDFVRDPIRFAQLNEVLTSETKVR